MMKISDLNFSDIDLMCILWKVNALDNKDEIKNETYEKIYNIISYDKTYTEKSNSDRSYNIMKVLEYLDKNENVIINPTMLKANYVCGSDTTPGEYRNIVKILLDAGLIEKTELFDLQYKNFDNYVASPNFYPLIENTLKLVSIFKEEYENSPVVREETINENKLRDEYNDYDNKLANNKVNSKEEILEYLRNISTIEATIYSYVMRYKKLCLILKEEKKQNLLNKIKLIILKKFDDKTKEKDIIELEEKIEKLNNSKKTITEIEDKSNIKKPIFDLEKPVEPKYQTILFFKRREKEIENNKLRDEYQNAVKKYNKEYEKYQENVTDYEKKVKEWKQKELEIENKKITNEISKLTKEKEQLVNQINNSIGFEESKTADIINYEIRLLKENIIKNLQLENQLYSLNILYPKYRNFVAIASFIDYLESDRCTELTGNNGAYNLYESEIRMDAIINKMDIIISSLEKIKENQFYLYQEIKEANKKLDKISDELIINNEMLKKQNLELEKITKNTCVSAFYDEKIAKYTKITAYLDMIK